MIVLSSDKVVRDILDKRSGSTSARMDVFIREFGEDLNILLKEYDTTCNLGVILISPAMTIYGGDRGKCIISD